MALATPTVYFEGANPKDAPKAQQAAKTILQHPDCKAEPEMTIDMQTGAYLDKSVKKAGLTIQKFFHGPAPEIRPATRLYRMACKTAGVGYDNFWLREQDIGNSKAVFRQAGQ